MFFNHFLQVLSDDKTFFFPIILFKFYQTIIIFNALTSARTFAWLFIHGIKFNLNDVGIGIHFQSDFKNAI